MAIAFERVVIVMLENASRDTVLANDYMNTLRKKGVFLKNSHGVTHPSQPNYFTLTGGDTLGFNSDASGWVEWYGHPDDPSYAITSIIDLPEAKGLTWKAYAEDLDTSDKAACVLTSSGEPCTTCQNTPPPDHGQFARRHVPFLSYPNIVNNPFRVVKIVNAQNNFQQDLGAGNLPNYSFYSPNLINDGHSLPNGAPANPVTDGDQLQNIALFLQAFLGDDPVTRFPPETLIVITFDEAYPVDAPYNIYTLLIGDMLPAGTTRMEPYNHYNLLRSVEDNFALGTLGRNDNAATPYWFLNI